MSSNEYAKAKEYLRKNNLKMAKEKFLEATNFSKTREKALLKIILLDLKEGNYKNARLVMDQYRSLFDTSYRLKILQAFLEFDEYNFKKAESILCQSFDEEHYDQIISHLAEIYMQSDLARCSDICYELLGKQECFNDALISLITLKILEKDYNTALDLLSEIDLQTLTYQQRETFNSFKVYLSYFMGKLREEFITNPEKNYKYYRLFDINNSALIKHLEKHKQRSTKYYSGGYFYKNINFSQLVSEVSEIIQITKPIHYQDADKYRIRLSRSIGNFDHENVRDICVVTIIDTNIILTMYPVKFSNEFDSENKSHIILPR